ncbi:MAG: protein kinase [Ktedonobacteraceae bacterium]|nr:protein kinase [Ktedonobacteraceae bacterium]
MREWTGQRLGNYQIIKLLGRGGFADVYLGEHLYLNTPAAIKVLRMQLAQGTHQRFLQEARTVARLNHANIVRVLEFGIEPTPFLVMSYAPFGSLRQRHPPGSQLPPPLLLSYVKQMARALQYAHDRNIVHRDVKPENMLLGDDHILMLSDFGIALAMQSITGTTGLTLAGSVVGTVQYMAPEQLTGRAGPASDQYALGCVVYEWFCGVPPFAGSVQQVAHQQMHVSPPAMRERAAHLTAAIEQVVMRALAKDPRARFASVQDFSLALEAACDANVAQQGVDATAPATLASPVNRVYLHPDVAGPSAPTVADSFIGMSLASRTPQVLQSPPLSPQSPPGASASPPVTPVKPDRPRSRARRNLLLGLGIGTGVVALSGGGLFAYSFLSSRVNRQPQKQTPPAVQATGTPTLAIPVAVNALPSRAAVAPGSGGTIELFVRGSDNRLWHGSYDSSYRLLRPWESLGSPGSLTYDPAVASDGHGHIDILVRTPQNTLQYSQYSDTARTWRPWQNLENGGEFLTLLADPAIAVQQDGRSAVFVCGKRQNQDEQSGIWYSLFRDSTLSWQPLDNFFNSSLLFTGTPAVVSSPGGRIDVFARGSDQTLYHNFFDGDRWNGWDQWGGNLASDPAAVGQAQGERINVFAFDGSGTIQHIGYNIPGNQWSSWETLRASASSLLAAAPAPGAVAMSNGSIDLFVRNNDHVLQRLQYNGSQLLQGAPLR